MQKPWKMCDRGFHHLRSARSGWSTGLLAGRQAGGTRSTCLAGCGHSPHLERPAEFTALVAGFLAEAG